MQNPNNTFTKKKVLFTAIIVCGIVLIIMLIYYKKSELFKPSSQNLKSNIEKTNILDNEKVEIIKNNSFNKNTDESQEALISTKSLLNYFTSRAPNTSSNPKASTDIHKNISITVNQDMYLKYLLSVNLLVFNFLQDKDYTYELHLLEEISLPFEIQNILNNLGDYNRKFLVEKISSRIKIFPRNYKWLEKLIKVEKESPQKLEKEKYREAILDKLEYFIQFFYSEKFKSCVLVK